jgi:aspartate racemase
MKTIGLIGGMSWESSIEYYRIINELTRYHYGGLHSAKCIMSSYDFDEIAGAQQRGNWEGLSDLLSGTARNLKSSGADFILICTNTMHLLADDVQSRADIPVLHIADATGRRIKEKGLKRVALLGTRYTMESDFYRKRLTDRYGLDVIAPGEEERGLVHSIIFNELCQGIIKQSSKEKLQDIMADLVSNGAQGIILGCTEIPLIIKQEDVDVPVFDTMQIHAEAAVEMAIGKPILHNGHTAH